MKLLIDENIYSSRLVSRLQKDGHDLVRPVDAGLVSASDPRVLSWAIGRGRIVLTRDYDDFQDLHLLVLASGGHHPGILAVRFDDDPKHNLSDQAICTAIARLEASGLAVADGLHVLNHWK